MEEFKRGFYNTSKKLERKPESNLGQSSFPQRQPFSQSQQPGEEQKQPQKTTYAITPISQEKPKKQMKSALHQKPDAYGIAHQNGTEAPGRGREAKKSKDKLIENLSKQEQIESRDQKQDKMEIEEIKVGKPLYKREVKSCYYCGSREHL